MIPNMTPRMLLRPIRPHAHLPTPGKPTPRLAPYSNNLHQIHQQMRRNSMPSFVLGRLARLDHGGFEGGVGGAAVGDGFLDGFAHEVLVADFAGWRRAGGVGG